VPRWIALSRGRCRRIGVPWGSRVFSGAAGALFIRRAGASAIWSLSGEYQTWRAHLETVAIDPLADMFGRISGLDGRGSHRELRLELVCCAHHLSRGCSA
jgi:hypothetical protein